MSILIDTNLLLRSVQPAHPMHASAVRAMALLMEREETLMVSIQNIVHDARLVAVMKAHGIGQIVTFNTSDFTRYPGINVIQPDMIL